MAASLMQAVAGRDFVKSRGDPPTLFDPVEQPFNRIA
jgi:hypothetical protein